MTAVGCGSVEVNPPQRSIKQHEKCGLTGFTAVGGIAEEPGKWNSKTIDTMRQVSLGRFQRFSCKVKCRMDVIEQREG